MFLLIAKSIGIGILIGFFYGFLFVIKLKRLYQKGSSCVEKLSDKEKVKFFKKKAVFSFSFFSVISNILLIGVFILLILKLDTNITALLISFVIAFWLSILLFSKPRSIKENKSVDNNDIFEANENLEENKSE